MGWAPDQIESLVPVGEVEKRMRAFESVETHHGSTYKDGSTVIIVPTRGQIDFRTVIRWQNLIHPMNQPKAWIFAAGHEVGHAYNAVLENVIAKGSPLANYKYVLTLEDDNLPPPDALLRLLESIEEYKLDAVSGIYFTKGEINMPMAYGSALKYAQQGILSFEPLDVRECLAAGSVLEVNGIAMGCGLWRMDLFREVPGPWFVTTESQSQDLYFCERARRAGKRFGVDMRVRVGHMDVNTGVVY